MNRTPLQRVRREALAEAASDSGRGRLPARIARARVVLYDCQSLPQRGRVLASHRTFAEARDWTIVAELVDRALPGRPVMAWPLWPRVAELLDSGQADGIVTCAWSPNDPKVMSWLLKRHAFAACIGASSETTAHLPKAG